MAKLLLNLRNVPDDEIADICAFLQEHEIAYYLTAPSFFGVSAGGIWLNEAGQYAHAKSLMASYQAQRQIIQRAARKEALARGETGGLWFSIKRNPLGMLMSLIVTLFLIALTLLPFYLFVF